MAITRAAERLHITWARQRNGRKASASPFVTGLPLGETTRMPMPAELREVAGGTARKTLEGSLRVWRRERARRLGTTESAVCADALLARIADHRPASIDDLARILGPMTAETVGEELLNVVAGFAGSDPK